MKITNTLRNTACLVLTLLGTAANTLALALLAAAGWIKS